MSEAELMRFLGEERVVTCASIGPNGRPHLMPLWYVVDDGVVTAWTYAKSQKVRNLERKPQATLQVEAGDAYAELRGAMLERGVGRRGRAARGLHDPPPEGDEVPRRLLCVPRRQSGRRGRSR